MSGRGARWRRHLQPSSGLALVVAVTAVSVLLLASPSNDRNPEARTITAAMVWPDAQRATLPGTLSDGAEFVPGYFLDARTAVGIAADPTGRSRRLVVRQADSSFRELRSLPLDRGPAYGAFAVAGRELVWVESTTDSPPRIWAADLAAPARPARQLTADIGAAAFTGSSYDLLIHADRVYWAAVPEGADDTQIRSVALTGGPVSVRAERGRWNLSAWPWLTDGNDRVSLVRLRNRENGRDVEIDGGAELLTCGPAWCRVTIPQDDGTNRLDLMRHDGAQRKTVAVGDVGVVGADVAVLDRFELLFTTTADAEQNKTALLVHDITGGRTVEISPAVDGAFSRAGVLWWSTDDGDSLVWQTLDLRTVP